MNEKEYYLNTTLERYHIWSKELPYNFDINKLYHTLHMSLLLKIEHRASKGENKGIIQTHLNNKEVTIQWERK